MILHTATKTIKSADLENDYDAVLVDERIVDGYPANKLVRRHDTWNVVSTLTFDSNGNPIYSVQDI
jgi:hypothetical protein